MNIGFAQTGTIDGMRTQVSIIKNFRIENIRLYVYTYILQVKKYFKINKTNYLNQ